MTETDESETSRGEHLAELEAAGEWRRAAELARDMGEPARAISLYDKLLDHESAGDVHRERGELILALDRYLRARAAEKVQEVERQLIATLSDDIGEAVELLAQHRRFHEAAELAASIGHPAEAARLFKEARNYLEAARLFERIGDVSEAGRLYEQHLAAEPSSPVANLGLGRILQRLERHIDACDALVNSLSSERTAEEARSRMVLSLASLRLRESARVLLSRGEVPTELEPAVGDLDSFCSAVQEHYGATEQGFSERYRVLSGYSGPFPESYIALDTMGEKRVLVQPLHGSQEARRRYVAHQRKLSEPPLSGVLPLMDADDRGRYAVFAAPGGQTLAERLEHAPPSPMQLRSMAEQVLKILQGAHSRGVLHSNLSPWAIYVRPGWTVSLAGFELPVLGSRAETATAGGVDNPLSYLAPEIAFGRDPDLRSDFFGLGAVLWRVVHGTPPVPSGVAESGHPLFDRLLAPDVSDRPGSHRAVAQLLAGVDWASVSIAVPPAAAESRGADREERFEKLRETASGTLMKDRWLSRTVEQVKIGRPLTLPEKERIRSLAQSDLPALQQILQVDPGEGVVLMAAMRGEPLSEVWGELSREERLRLVHRIGATLEALHAVRQALDGFDAEDIEVDRRTGTPRILLGQRLLSGDDFEADIESWEVLVRRAREGVERPEFAANWKEQDWAARLRQVNHWASREEHESSHDRQRSTTGATVLSQQVLAWLQEV